MKNPMLDIDFLKQLDEQKNHEVYAKIVALTFDENPTEEISGKVTQGSINIDGTSAIRRSCSLTLVAKDVNINDFYWGLNTKFKLFIGLKNTIDPQYDDIVWFKQGMFLITTFSTSLNASSYTISISGKDKMCLLNGDIGGAINSLSVDFGKYDEVDIDGNVVKYDYPIREIVKEAVHQYASEPYHNIVINDLDEIGLELMEYRGDIDVFMLIDNNASVVTNMVFDTEETRSIPQYCDDQRHLYTLDQIPVYDTRLSELDFNGNNTTDFTKIHPITNAQYELNSAGQKMRVIDFDINNEITYTVARITYGETCGYRITDLTYAGDLIGTVGSSITSSVLDKIVSMLGEYEYFYNVDGQFVFQRKRTYVYNSWNTLSKDGLAAGGRSAEYADSAAYSSAYSYSFTGSNLVTAFQNTPNLSNLKNDFSIWGSRKSASGSDIPIHLRYAIDVKPTYYRTYGGKIFVTQNEFNRLKQQEETRKQFTEQTIITTNGTSAFKVTALPQGLPDSWWEIDDWARRYLYYADVNNTHPMSYYVNLSGAEVVNIISKSSAPKDASVHDFNYYCWQLKLQRLNSFSQSWGTADWLTILPPSSETSDYSRRYYYTPIQRAANQGGAFWAFLFDTALDSSGQEYITSIEHGYEVTADSATYPTTPVTSSGCGHSFNYALQRKAEGANKYYHMYICSPDVPASLKSDIAFVEKIGTDETQVLVTPQNYEVTDWREIIYQMAKDYYQHQHDEDFLSRIAENNKDYYPDGYTGYEQYYIDMEGFWRQLYNPEVQPIDLNNTHPNMDINHYYIWHPDTETFTDYSFRQATKIADVPANKQFFYYNGIRTLEYLIKIEQDKVDAIDNAKRMLDKERRAITVADFSSKEVYDKVIANITAKYKAIIAENEASLRPRILEIPYKDDKGNTLYNYEKAKEIIPEYYPYYEQVDDANWREYCPYTLYSDQQKYYLEQFVKDLSKLSDTEEYYYADNGQYIKELNVSTIQDKVAKPNEDGTYQTKVVPAFQLGRKYYIYKGYEKVPILEAGDNGNIYYTYGSYKPAAEFVQGTQYYTRTLGSHQENIFTKAVVLNADSFKPKQHYVAVEKFNPADKTILRGYQEILRLNKNTTYYGIVKDSAGRTITTTPTYFTRDKDYYTKDANGELQYAFTFMRGVVYYLLHGDKGFEEILDLTNCSLDNKYYVFGDSAKSNVGKYFCCGNIYYGFVLQDNANVTNGKYYIQNPANPGSCTECTVLRKFVRGGTYYVNDLGYDKLDYVDYSPEEEYYVLASNGTYIKINSLIPNVRPVPEEEAKLLRNQYGILVLSDGTIDGLGQAYDFYRYVKRYREYDYYQFAFYEIAKEYQDGVNYYIYNNDREYAPSPTSVTRQNFANHEYYTLVDTAKLSVYLTDEFNLRTHWTFKLDTPELLNFWFDFLNINGDYVGRTVNAVDFAKQTYFEQDEEGNFVRAANYDSSKTYYEYIEGELAQYSVHAIGDRPKTINDKDVKAIYYRDTPTVIFVGVDGAYIQLFINEETFYKQKQNLFVKQKNSYIPVGENDAYGVGKDYYRQMEVDDRKPGYTYINLTDTVDNLFSISAQGKTAFDTLDKFLFDYSYCAEAITMTTIPIYHLDPNTRIFVDDPKSGILGEYLVTKITLPLQYNGTMSITATKAVNNIK